MEHTLDEEGRYAITEPNGVHPVRDMPSSSDDGSDPHSDDVGLLAALGQTSLRSFITVAVLVVINLLNYMDRYTIASVLKEIQAWFSIEDTKASLLNTIFVCSYMVFAPLFGYLGDRFSRKYVMAFGILIWVGTTLAGSFVGREGYWLFFVIRGLVGIGEASYSTIAPTIIADLFVGDVRTCALMCFYFAIPCGSGLGYIVGSRVAKLCGAWYWAFRVTPVLGAVCVIFCIFVIHEPKRGAIESKRSGDLQDLSASLVHPTGSWFRDIAEVFKVKSFVWSTLGSTAIAFTVGTWAFWGPRFLIAARHSVGDSVEEDTITFSFGIVTFVSGVIGVLGGTLLAACWRNYNRQADALVCGLGVMFAGPFLFFAMWNSNKILMLTWVLIAFGEILMFFNWTPNADILLYVIVPSRRSTAEAVQILVLHLFGDATGPFIIGAISDAIRGPGNDTPSDKYVAYLYALYITPFVCILGGVFYIMCAMYLIKDKENAAREAREQDRDSSVSRLDCLPAPDGDPHTVPPHTVHFNDDVDEDEPPISTSDSEGLLPDVRIRNPSPPKKLLDLASAGTSGEYEHI